MVAVYGLLGATAFVLSLGSEPTYNGRVLFHNPVYAWLHGHVPGFAQLRTPARFVIVSQLALSVVAAAGVAVWLDWRRPQRGEHIVTAAVLSALVFLEGLGAPVPVQAFSPYRVSGDRPAYHWLKQQPAGPMLELPLDGWGHTHYSMIYQYRTLLHGHPIVNGIGRFTPPLPAMLADPESPLVTADRSSEAVAFLRHLGVRYVFVHRTWYARRDLGEAMDRAIAAVDNLKVMRFGDTTAVDLGPVFSPPALAERELPPATMNLSASRGDVTRLVDRNPATRWLTGRPQNGLDYVEVRLPRRFQVIGARLQLLGRSLNDYPRGLEVSVSRDGDQYQTVFAGSVLPALAFGLRRAPRSPTIDLRWPGAETQVVRLHQRGGCSRWYWSIHELRILGEDRSMITESMEHP
jgi:hypothetical protein